MTSRALKSKAKKESQLPPAGPLMNRVSSSTSSLQSNSVQIKTYVDEQMNLNELMKMGSRGRMYESNRPAPKFPLAFNQPVNRSRGSSAGHSPKGSSDDNFSHPRNTLSPGGMDGSGVYGTAPAMRPRHEKMPSAPELNHHHFEQQQQQTSPFSPHQTPAHQHTGSLHAPSATRPVQIPQQPTQMHFASKSVSAIDQQFYDGSAAPQIQAHHNRSTSYDVTHASHFNPAQGFGGYQNPAQAHSHQEIYGMGMPQHPSQQMQQPKEKSVSMDPIIVSQQQQQPQPQPQPMQQPRFETPSEIDMSLPPNWSIGRTEQGDIFFIDHNNHTTTWYDPRIPHHMQEERIRVLHGVQAANDPNAAAAAAQVAAHQQAQAAAQQAAQAQQQQQMHFGMGQVPQQQQPPHQMLDQSSDARIQSLQSEVNALHERQRELMQQGLYGSPQPMYDHSVNNNMDQQPYFQQQPQQQRPPSMPAYQQDEPMDVYVAPAHMMNRYTVDNFNSDELNQYLGEMQM